MKRIAVVSTLVLVAAGGLALVHRDLRGNGSADCKVNGVWELVSQTYGTKTEKLGPKEKFHQRKIVADGYFMWLAEENRRDTLPLKTPMDTMNFYWQQGGSGKMRVSGSNYTEIADYFMDPTKIGHTWNFSCRIEGKRWYHTQVPATDSSVNEVWERIN